MASDDVSRIESLLREHFARTDKQLSDMRAENAEFHVQMMKDFNAFTEKIDTRISKFEEKVNARFEKIDARFERLEEKVAVMQNDMTGLKHDVGNLQTWNYWTLSIIIALLAMPQILTGIKALIGAAADAVSAVARIFRREDKA